MRIYIEKSHLDIISALNFEKAFIHAVLKTIKNRGPICSSEMLLISNLDVNNFEALIDLGVFVEEEDGAHVGPYIPECVRSWLEFSETNKKVKAAIAKAGKK